MTEGNQQANQQQQQQRSPLQRLGHTLANIRKVQNMLELNYPHQVDAIKMLREAGDVVWEEIQRMQQQSQQQASQ